jgi:hypothetical protein
VLTEIYNLRRDRYAEADIHIAVSDLDRPETVCDRLLTVMGETINLDRLKEPKDEANSY